MVYCSDIGQGIYKKQDFARLLDKIENSNIKDEIVVQAGHTKYKSDKMKIVDFIFV